MFDNVIQYIRKLYRTDQFIPLHEPKFVGNERKYVMDAIDSTFVSSVGAYVDRFEKDLAEKVGAKYAIACVNGTAALHMALIVAGVKRNDLVITQPLSFIATCNAISYIGAKPAFVDVDQETLGLCPKDLLNFLMNHAELRDDGFTYHKDTQKRISACVPMHTFGHPCQIDRIVEICKDWNIVLIEDAAESIGSYFNNQHTGTFGLLGTFSFNGNKTITSGGGGAIVTNDEELARLAKHLTTQAKVPHRWDFVHDHIGYNYRLPNINAALLCAQLEQLDLFVSNKRDLAALYSNFFQSTAIKFINEPDKAKSNYWLCAIRFKNREERDIFLQESNDSGVMTRPSWTLMNELTMFKDSVSTSCSNSKLLQNTIVNIPSSVRF